MRIGIMGGTLDPVHNGHICIARYAMQALSLDRVMLLPAGDPPHKENPTLKQDRLSMARLAAQDCPGMYVSDMEITRSGTTYTVDTLAQLHQKHADTEWIYIIGADTLEVLDSWRDFARVARMIEFAVVGRGDEPACRSRAQELHRQYGADIRLLPFNGPEISSTEIRRRVSAGGSIAGLVPAAVEEYILEQGLYLSAMPLPRIHERLRQSLKPSRYRHTLGVVETALRLAERFGVNPRHAELAALLHDCAKYMPLEQMQLLAREHAPDLDAQELCSESVLHAPAGMALARLEFGVHHPEILSAIRKHTLGDSRMSALDALIYTADFIEPNRRDFPGLEEARNLAEKDIFAAARKCAELTNDYLFQQGKQAHPRSISMLQSAFTEKGG